MRPESEEADESTDSNARSLCRRAPGLPPVPAGRSGRTLVVGAAAGTVVAGASPWRCQGALVDGPARGLVVAVASERTGLRAQVAATQLVMGASALLPRPTPPPAGDT